MEKSAAEIMLKDFWDKMSKMKIISMNDLDKFGNKLSKLFLVCEELRKSRDNWRKKYEELRHSQTLDES